MLSAAIAAFSLLAALAAFQVAGTAFFIRVLGKAKPQSLADEQFPRTVLMLGLKGGDEGLKVGLRSLINQTYPDYEFDIVVHSHDDPAWEIVQQAVAEPRRINVSVNAFRKELDEYHLHCSNAKTVQTMATLDESFEMIAMAEGALIPHPDWLRELIAPMVRDPSVGATFANRWYMPREGQWGSLLRYVWNIPGVIMMYLHDMPWGGSMALRRSIVDPELIEEWKKIIAIDATIPRTLKRHGQRVEFVPLLMMVTRSETTIGACMNFTQRQLTWTRVYHDRWWVIVATVLLTTGVLVGGLLLAIAGLLSGRYDVAAWAGSGLAVYELGMLLGILWIEAAVRRVVALRNEPTQWMGIGTALRLPIVLVLSQLLYPVVMWHATFARFVRWRGLTLEIRGHNDIRNVDEPSSKADAEASRQPAAVGSSHP